ncbi:MAG: cysteine hydrolase [Candidatus Bathyarchaeota archaeon]|nr:cysteine hydrolase [Candidatus Bathyarchaeota archaeon]
MIVDVQNGVLGKENQTYNAKEVLNNLEHLIKKARTANVPVIYVQHNAEKHLEPNTFNWQIHKTIAPTKDELRIQKHHPSSFHDTSLLEDLRKLGVTKLVIGGLQTEWCIDSTVRHAFSLGFDVTVVEDGHSTMDTSTLSAKKVVEHHNRIFKGQFACLKKAAEIDFQ